MSMEEQKEKADWPREKPKRDKREEKGSIEVDMNPMVDLAFLLLTFFMLATTFSQPQLMELVMPVLPEEEDVEQEQPVKETQALSIVLGEEDQVYWYVGITQPEVHQFTWNEQRVHQVLEEAQSSMSELVLLIKPMGASRYENLIDLLDEINAVGIERYAIAEVTKEDRALLPAD